MRALILIEVHGLPPRTHTLKVGDTVCFGRGREATIRIDDARVSRQHVNVTLTPFGLEVEDLGSRNGTLLDGKPLPPLVKTPIQVVGILSVGDARVRCQIEEEAGRETRRIDMALVDLDAEYEALGECGQGASGKVYVARHKRIGRTVAVKALKPQYQAGSLERERFLREGKLAAKVKSPYVVEVFDVRVCDDRAYIIMELVQGSSAKERLQKGPFPLAEALRVSEDVARALAAAASAGIVHRDVKPGNILIDAEGQAKLADFGIAKDLDESKIQALTTTGDGLGTLAYVSPEQATDARQVDHRTDIYGLGATIFHLVGGRPPFMPTSAKVLLDILDRPPPPLSAYAPGTPPEIVQLVARMLEKNPDDRPQTAQEVAQRLREIRLKLGFLRTAGADSTLDARSTDGQLKIPSDADLGLFGASPEG